jgi:iron complex transport system substrate-binding protein
MELLLSIKPEWFTVYPYGHDGYEKYTSKGINCLPISEYLETHPLGRAEWIKVFGELCGKSKEANAVFTSIKNEYNKFKGFIMNYGVCLYKR